MLLAITRSPIDWDGTKVTRRLLDSWHVLAVKDDELTRISESPHSLALSHSPFTALDQPDRGIGTFASVETVRKRVTLRRSLSSGSSLYYTVTARGELICATRVTALRQAGVLLEEDRQRLPEFFVYCFVCPPATLFKGIYLLPQDEELSFEEQAGAWRITARSILELPKVRSSSATDFGSEGAAVLTEAMCALGPLDARTAVLLSGGVDSSVLSRLAQQQGYAHSTFGTSYPFEHPDSDIEASYASSAAEGLAVSHKHHVPTVDQYLAGVVDAINATEVPVHSLQTALLSCLYRDAIPDAVRVIVVGVGADTVFGNSTLKGLYDAGTPLPLERLVSSRAALKVLWRSGTGIGGRLADVLWTRRNLMFPLDDPRHLIWSEQRFGDVEWTCAHFAVDPADCSLSRRDVLARYTDESLLNRFLLLNVLGDSEVIQTMWACLAHATGRVAYYPYTFPSVFRVATSIPWSARVPETKFQLRQAARLIGVPEFILTRPKAHFGIAADRWAARGGVLEPLVRLAAPVVGEATLRKVQVSRESLARIYWNLINYAIWRRLFIDGESVSQIHDELREAIAETPNTAAGDLKAP